MTLPRNSHHASSTNNSGQESGIRIAEILEEKHSWAELYESFRDAFFPPALPPLELTSTAVPVPDRMAVKPNPWAFGSSAIVNGGVLTILLLMGLRAAFNPRPKPVPTMPVDLNQFNLIAPMNKESAHGGGGGGTNALTDPVTGRPPRFEEHPMISPQVLLLAHPVIAVDPAVAAPPNIRLPENLSMPAIGVQNSARVTLASNGEGTRNGMGTGADGGVGPGAGIGYGPGGDRGINGGFYTPGIGGVSNPVPIFTPEAEFSDEARRAKHQGVCEISVIVDAHGYPQNPLVIQPLGMGLDEKALAAVREYRFKPAMRDGKPVAVKIIVAVNFRLF